MMHCQRHEIRDASEYPDAKIQHLSCLSSDVAASCVCAKQQFLGLVVDGQNTCSSHTTENVGTSALEKRSHALGGNDLASSVQHAGVVNLFAGSHHHTSADSVERVRSHTRNG